MTDRERDRPPILPDPGVCRVSRFWSIRARRSKVARFDRAAGSEGVGRALTLHRDPPPGFKSADRPEYRAEDVDRRSELFFGRDERGQHPDHVPVVAARVDE